MPRIFREYLWLALAPAFLLVSPTHAADEHALGSPRAISQSSPGDTDINRTRFDAINPSIAADPDKRRVLVVWSATDGDSPAEDPDTSDDVVPLVAPGEHEIFASLLDAELVFSRTNQFRLSVMGDDLEEDPEERERYGARNPAVIWNPVSNEYLVVWEGDDDASPLVDDEFEIFGQRMARNGTYAGKRFRISIMGSDNEADPAERARYGAAHPAIAVNSVTGDYLVTWQGDTDTGGLVDDETEIFGRLFDKEGKARGSQFRVSFAGDESETREIYRSRFDATRPAAAYNPVSDRFIITWQADDNQNGLVNDENEIFLQTVTPDGSLDGSARRVSNMGPGGDAAFDALQPAIAVVPDTGTMLVTWHGDTSGVRLVEGEFEVHARLLDASGVAMGDALRISRMGPDDETDPAERQRYTGEQSSVSWNSDDRSFLVAWRGDTVTGRLVDDEYEIHGVFLDENLSLLTNRFKLSEQGSHDSEDDAEEREKFAAYAPQIAYLGGYHVVTWYGDTNKGSGFDNQDQVFVRRAADEWTLLDLTRDGPDTIPKAPEPIHYFFELENKRRFAAENVRLDISNTEGLPFDVVGCESFVDNICELGTIPGKETVEFELIVYTDEIEIGDAQSTRFEIFTYSDTALETPAFAYDDFFTSASLTVEGGSGSSDWLWLLMLSLVPLAARRRD